MFGQYAPRVAELDVEYEDYRAEDAVVMRAY
ncbi:hypothetical protein [Mycobacterium lepromatosis]|nr:hypothetical protein MLPF_1526 [Mycobacterium lepromatosis]